jgi:hypothetical protein
MSTKKTPQSSDPAISSAASVFRISAAKRKAVMSRYGVEKKTVAPAFGRNYDIGYIGFTYTPGNPVSEGIAHFTRWPRMSSIIVSHVLIVTGADECVEALMGRGIVRSPLSKYFNSKTTEIFLRKPLNYTREIGEQIAEEAGRQVGLKYDDLLIASFMLSGSMLGRLLRKAAGNRIDHMVSSLSNRSNRFICSELAAHCLDAQPEYRDKGILSEPSHMIDPQELFEDQHIFTPWHTESSAPQPGGTGQ